MRLEQATIRQAFRMHGEVYAAIKGWDIPYHIECWRHARAAFEQHSLDEFEHLYRELKNRWQVFRGAKGKPWTPREAFDRLHALPWEWRTRRLSRLTDDDLPACWNIIDSVKDIKPMRNAPSVVAVSKFLHFWNPQLFVIVDDAVVWNWVFRHRWLKRPVRRVRERIGPLLPDAGRSHAGPACDLLSYLAILRWSADVLRANPYITAFFVDHIRARASTPAIDLPLGTYEAAAVEWLLLGLVELPPQGVAVTATEHSRRYERA